MFENLIAEIFSPEGFSALLQVIAIDLVLAGDNAIVIGLAAAGLPAHQLQGERLRTETGGQGNEEDERVAGHDAVRTGNR